MHPCVLPMHWQGQTSRECIGETSIVYAYLKGATVECVYLGWLRPPPGAPQQQWCLRECECEVRVDRPHATTQGVSYAIRTTFRLSRLCTTHYVSVLYIKRRKPAGEGYLLRTTYPYCISSAESPPERAICTTHHVSVLCIKRRKPPGESYGVRITYPYYISSAEP